MIMNGPCTWSFVFQLWQFTIHSYVKTKSWYFEFKVRRWWWWKVTLVGGGDPHSSSGLLRNCLVAHGIYPQHMWHCSFALRQSMDLPNGSRVLWRICHLGADWAPENLRRPWFLLSRQLVLPRWSRRSLPCLVGSQSLPKASLDPPYQHASPVRCHRDDATSHSRQLHQLDYNWIHFRLHHLPIPAQLVAAPQLRAFWCTGCWFGLHGSLIVFVSGVRGD